MKNSFLVNLVCICLKYQEMNWESPSFKSAFYHNMLLLGWIIFMVVLGNFELFWGQNIAGSNLIWTYNTYPPILLVIFGWDQAGSGKKNVKCAKTAQICNFGTFWAILRPKYGWIQLDLDWKYIPPYIASDFWVRSS